MESRWGELEVRWDERWEGGPELGARIDRRMRRGPAPPDPAARSGAGMRGATNQEEDLQRPKGVPAGPRLSPLVVYWQAGWSGLRLLPDHQRQIGVPRPSDQHRHRATIVPVLVLRHLAREGRCVPDRRSLHQPGTDHAGHGNHAPPRSPTVQRYGTEPACSTTASVASKERSPTSGGMVSLTTTPVAVTSPVLVNVSV